MRKGYFINIAFDKAIKTYLASINEENSIIYNSFLVMVIRILTFIYGRLDILNPYYLDNSVAFFNNLAKYGMNKGDLALFKEEFLGFYQFEIENQDKKYKVANPYFKSTLKYLVDMFIYKKKNASITYQEEETFLDLVYTTHTKHAYRISEGYLNLPDPLYIEKYYYSKLNEIDMTREININETISSNLNLDALNVMGIGLSNLENMNLKQIEDAQNNAYGYFKVDIDNPNREEELKEKVDFYKLYGKKITTGNGYVDILLLMSVIATSFSVIAILIFHFI